MKRSTNAARWEGVYSTISVAVAVTAVPATPEAAAAAAAGEIRERKKATRWTVMIPKHQLLHLKHTQRHVSRGEERKDGRKGIGEVLGGRYGICHCPCPARDCCAIVSHRGVLRGLVLLRRGWRRVGLWCFGGLFCGGWILRFWRGGARMAFRCFFLSFRLGWMGVRLVDEDQEVGWARL